MLRTRKRPFTAGLALVGVLLLAAPAGAAEQQPEGTLVDQVCDWLWSFWGDPAPGTAEESDDSLRVRDKGGEIDPNG